MPHTAIKPPADPALPDAAPPTPQQPGRVMALDVARGLTIVWMIFYHLCWDLTFFGVVRLDLLYDPVWWVQPRIITSLFITWVGIGLALATAAGLPVRRYLRRTALIALAAAVITGATMVAFPDSFIFFGILHCIAATSLIGLALRRLPALSLVPIGLVLALLPEVDLPAVFDHPWLIWLGLGDRVPRANDFIPLMPYAAPMVLGLLLGRWLAASPAARPLTAWPPRQPAPLARLTAWMGRHSLAIYLIHQPLLLGLLFGLHYGLGLFQPDIANVMG